MYMCRLALGEHVWSFAQTLTSQRGGLVAMQRWRDGENVLSIDCVLYRKCSLQNVFAIGSGGDAAMDG